MPNEVKLLPCEVPPTHYCVVCAARWVNHANGSWSLATAECGPCCDNVPMDTAPIVKIQPDGSVDGRDHDKVRRAYDAAQRKAQVERYRGILCAHCDEPFERHSSDWTCPRRVAPRFKFPAEPEATRPTTVVTDEVVERLCALHEKMLNAVKRARPYPVSIRMGQSDLDTVLDAAVALERALASMPTVVTGEQPQSLGVPASPSGSRPSDQVRLRGLGHTASIPNACNVPPEGWWCSRSAGHDAPCAAREIMPAWYAKLIRELRDPPYWSAEYGPDDTRLDIAPRHASDALEITLTALQSVKRVALACEGTPYDLILSYAEHALKAKPSCGFWVSGASVDTLPKGQDAKQGLAGTEGSAVAESETPTPSSAQPGDA